AQNPGAKGVFGVSPTYHGICSDMKGLIDVTHRGGGIFIADEAHGNHVYFHEDLPEGALRLGADLACQSIHKMSGSLTQSSLLHLKSGRIDLSRLKANLQLAQNTSPSYLLMASLDLARSFIATEGHALFDRLIPEIDAAREEMKKIPGIEVLDKGLAGTCGIFAYEPMRLVFSAREMGVEGYELYDVLRDAYGIEIEFGDYYYAICVLGLGTEKGDLDRLIRALKDLSSRRHGLRPPLAWDEELPGIPPMAMLPRRAHFAERERVSWADAKGRVSAEMVVPYPPGIPVLCPGEIVTDEVWDFLDYQNRNGRHLHGPESGKLTHLHVVRE
ncbi:MAG: arginine decarboxylase, partial [Clostridiales Family XIII bacterium]|nr:arginine decarboxylase [Clostridiales Family XIII bacterium]